MSKRSISATAADDPATLPTNSPNRESIVYRNVMEARSSHREGHVQRKWNQGATNLYPPMPSEHRQLVDAVHATDGVSRVQADLQVTAFEQFFMDDTQLL
jgi:hypothetical protein